MQNIHKDKLHNENKSQATDMFSHDFTVEPNESATLRLNLSILMSLLLLNEMKVWNNAL